MNISDVAKKTGLTSKAIRFYEEKGLVTPPLRSENGYRTYSQQHLDELTLLRQARQVGFNLGRVPRAGGTVQRPVAAQRRCEKTHAGESGGYREPYPRAAKYARAPAGAGRILPRRRQRGVPDYR